MFTQEDVERVALEIYKEAKKNPERLCPIGILVRAILHTGITRAILIAGRAADKYVLHGKVTIAVRIGIPMVRAKWLAAHELTHWWCDREGIRVERMEAFCNGWGSTDRTCSSLATCAS